MIEESKYKSLWGYIRNNYVAYREIERRGLIPKMCEKYGWKEKTYRKPDGYWTKEKVHEEALKYNTRTKFSDGSGSAYNLASIRGWLDEICSHMDELQKPYGYWTKEKVHEEALKYNTKDEFRRGSGSVYNVTLRNGWVDEICSHMEQGKKPNGYWTKENVHEVALKCKNRSEFSKVQSSAYNVALRNKWLDDFFPRKIKQL